MYFSILNGIFNFTLHKRTLIDFNITFNVKRSILLREIGIHVRSSCLSNKIEFPLKKRYFFIKMSYTLKDVHVLILFIPIKNVISFKKNKRNENLCKFFEK